MTLSITKVHTLSIIELITDDEANSRQYWVVAVLPLGVLLESKCNRVDQLVSDMSNRVSSHTKCNYWMVNSVWRGVDKLIWLG